LATSKLPIVSGSKSRRNPDVAADAVVMNAPQKWGSEDI
jgi:hypothetical protein